MRKSTKLVPTLQSLESRALLSTMVESEPNSRLARADVASSADVQISGKTTRNDVDYFRYTAPSAGTVTVSLTSTGRANAGLSVVGASGQGNSQTFSVQSGETLIFRVLGAGRGTSRYLLSIDETTPTPTKAPTVPSMPSQPTPSTPVTTPTNPTVTSPTGSTTQTGVGFADATGAPSTVAETESNDGLSSANPFSIGSDGNAHLSGSLSGATDADYFTFTAPKSGRLTFTLKGTGAAVKLDALDSSGTSHLTLYSDRSNFISYTNVTAGATYYVRLSPGAGAAANYTVDLRLT